MVGQNAVGEVLRRAMVEVDTVMAAVATRTGAPGGRPTHECEVGRSSYEVQMHGP